jgi:hypothetical protein
MIDEIFDRTYREGRDQLNAGLTHGLQRAFAATSNAFLVLNRIEYQAPWIRGAVHRHRI